jgi:outer membrane protein assembly factor BamD (BamD/ComL family)
VVRHPSPRSGGSDVAAKVPLAAELVLVDRGRALLQGGEPRAALAALDRYERDFADPRLLPEVLYLRMEALERLGMVQQATTVARQLAQSFPRSPHASRARAVLAGRRLDVP